MGRTLSTKIERDIEDAADEIRMWANDTLDNLYSNDRYYDKEFSPSRWLNKLLPLVEDFATKAYAEHADSSVLSPQVKHAGLRALHLLYAIRTYGAAHLDYIKWRDEYDRLFSAENHAGIDEVVSCRKDAFNRCEAAWNVLMPLWEAEDIAAKENGDTGERHVLLTE